MDGSDVGQIYNAPANRPDLKVQITKEEVVQNLRRQSKGTTTFICDFCHFQYHFHSSQRSGLSLSG